MSNETKVADIPDLTKREEAALADMSKEYYALFDTITAFDARLMIIKGWSVTLSLAAIALAFQRNHYILFLVGAVTAASFWLLEVVAKGHPLRYYSRMRTSKSPATTSTRSSCATSG